MQNNMQRLDKFLTECGVGTRSEVKKIIRSGAVTVNGNIEKGSDFKVNSDTDLVMYQGKKLAYEEFLYYLFHKPAGCVTANDDIRHKTVMEYLPEEVRRKCAAVGRLDKDTEGLLLFTNDGVLSHRLRSPSHHVSKTYYARLDAPVPAEAIQEFRQGISIGDEKPTLPAELEILDEGQYSAKLTITEGRYHQVKRMFYAVGCNVIYLKRLTMGPLELGDLPIGEYRKLSQKEIELLKES